MMQQYKGKTVQEWIVEAEHQKLKTGKEYMVVQWGSNCYTVHGATRHVAEYARVVYRTDEAVE